MILLSFCFGDRKLLQVS